MVEAFEECLADSGIAPDDIQAAWLGTCMDEINVGKSALPLSMTLRLPFIPVTGWKTSAPAAPSPSGERSTPWPPEPTTSAWPWGGKAQGHGLRRPAQSRLQLGVPELALVAQYLRPGAFAQLASAYAAKYKIPDGELKRALAHVSARATPTGS